MKIFIVFLLLISGCKNVVVRDANVYRAELDFIDAAAQEQVDRGKAIIASECECSAVMGIEMFTTSECSDLAETVLTVEARMKYHTDFMRYLGGLTDDRPPKNPPDIPDSNILCNGKNGDK